MVSKIFYCFKSCKGQASLEAAILLPTVLTLCMLMLQPICLLYTQMVMSFAAADSLRLLAYQSSDHGIYAQDRLKEYVLHRLIAIPHVEIFHVGDDQAWEVTFQSGQNGSASIEISHKVKPLPFYKGLANVLPEYDGTYISMSESQSIDLRQPWLLGTYANWMMMWDE